MDMFRRVPVWLDLGDGSLVDAKEVFGVGAILAPDEQDKSAGAKHERRLLADGFQCVVICTRGNIYSKYTAEDVSKALRSIQW